MNKRITVFGLIVAILLLMVACGSKITSTENTTESVETTMPTQNVAGVIFDPENTLADDELEVRDGTVPVDNDQTEEESTTPTQEDEKTNTEATQETTPVSSKPEESLTEYETYMAMSGEEQVEFYNTFDSVEEFMAWFNAAKAEYEEKNPAIDIGNGIIDVEDLINGNG